MVERRHSSGPCIDRMQSVDLTHEKYTASYRERHRYRESSLPAAPLLGGSADTCKHDGTQVRVNQQTQCGPSLDVFRPHCTAIARVRQELGMRTRCGLVAAHNRARRDRDIVTSPARVGMRQFPNRTPIAAMGHACHIVPRRLDWLYRHA